MADNLHFTHIKPGMFDEYCELLNLAFPGDGVDLLARRLAQYPKMVETNLYALWDGGKMVATLDIIPQTWSLGGVPLRVAEMGLVATHPDYRNRGLQRRLNAEFDRQMKAEGYHLAGLEGIPYFYRQFGFEYAVPLDEATSIPLTQLTSGDPSPFSPLLEAEIPQAMKLLEKDQSRYIVHSLRSRDEWETQERIGWVGEHQNTTYALRAKGKVKAYIRIEVKDKDILMHECAGVGDDNAPGVAAFIRKLGEEKGATNLVSRESYAEPFSSYLISLGATRRLAYAWQMKIVDHKRMFEALAPVFERRIAASPLKGYTGDILINFYIVAITLSLREGKFSGATEVPKQNDVVLINPKVFPKLLLAYRSIDELIAEYPDVQMRKECKPIVDVLFPKGEAHIHTCY